jgi:hypothetical protein
MGKEARMKTLGMLAAGAVLLTAAMTLPSGALERAGSSSAFHAHLAFAASYSSTKGFRRCMRSKYGPRYFSRVPRAHRWHMAQACMA